MGTVLLDVSVVESASRVRGIGRYVSDLAGGLERIGAASRVELIGAEQLPLFGAPVLTRDLGAALARIAGRPIISHGAWAYRTRLGLGRAAALAGADVVHSGHPEATPLWPGRRWRRLVTAHDLIPLRYPARYVGWKDGWARGRRRLDHRRYHHADHVIAVSQATADDLMAMLAVPASKITVVHNGVDLARWSGSPPEHPAGEDSALLARHGLADARYFFYVGATDWRKNVEGMLGGLVAARRRAKGDDLCLVMAGDLRKTWQDSLRERTAAMGLGTSVRALGFVGDDELGALYRGAVASLFVSRAEGFGYPVIESMAAGCPVIASNCSSVAEIASGAALCVDPEDHAAIGEAMAALAKDAGARDELRRDGLLRARDFSVERMARGTLAVYERLM